MQGDFRVKYLLKEKFSSVEVNCGAKLNEDTMSCFVIIMRK